MAPAASRVATLGTQYNVLALPHSAESEELCKAVAWNGNEWQDGRTYQPTMTAWT